MAKIWRIAPHDVAQVEAMRRATGLPALVAQLLVCRGFQDPDAVHRFLDAKLAELRDPFELPGIELAVEKIFGALREKRRILIYGDYDADGITGSATLVRCLKLLGGNVSYYVPNRLNEGYGLNDSALEKLASRGAQMVVTVDCGIASVEQADTARRLGLELIITDHHSMAERLPAADAIVHPALPGTDYPFTGLSGSGVAFKLAWALCKESCQSQRVSPELRSYLLQAIGLAAIGTVADIVPLQDENRILVRHGLTSLQQRPVLGVAALMAQAGLDKKESLASEDIGFMLAPRLNAAGRLGQAPLAVELLTTEDRQRAVSLAEYLDQLNKNRDSLERSVYLAANRQAAEEVAAGAPALVLGSPGWHAGVIGIVAGRLAEKYHRPVLLVSFDESGVNPGIGSGRSVPGLNLVEALHACRGQLVTYGGHAAAAGFKMEESNLEGLRVALSEYVAEEIPDSKQAAELRIDGEVPFAAITLPALEQIDRLAPFGQSNPRPLFCTTNVKLASAPKTIGSSGRHLALELEQHGVRMRGVAFGRGESAASLEKTKDSLAFAYRPVINDFRGMRRVEIHVVDWQQESHAADKPSPIATGSLP